MYNLDIVFISVIVVSIFVMISMKFLENKEFDSVVVYGFFNLDLDRVYKENKENKENKEKFIVSDAQDIHNYNEIKEKLLKESDKFEDEKELVGPEPEKPYEKMPIKIIDSNKNNINEEKDYNSYISAIDPGWDSKYPLVKCGNSSIQKRYTTGKEKLKPFSVSCSYPEEVNNYTFFNKFYNAPQIPLEDYTVRGANYNDYSDSVYPTKLNVRILSHNTKGLPLKDTKYKNIPVGSNYAFQNTPAMRI